MDSSPIFVGIHGNVFCLDRNTGQEIWSVGLGNAQFVTLLVDGDRILAATSGEIFGLEAATGKILWRNKMPGQGFGLASLATATQATNPTPPAEEHRRQEAAAGAAVAGAAAR